MALGSQMCTERRLTVRAHGLGHGHRGLTIRARALQGSKAFTCNTGREQASVRMHAYQMQCKTGWKVDKNGVAS